MLKFDKTNINLGFITYGDRPYTNINITNQSNNEIILSNHVSCGSCTSTEITPNPIPPNGNATLKVTIDSKNAGFGDLFKTVRLSWFDNGVNYSEVIKIQLNVSRS